MKERYTLFSQLFVFTFLTLFTFCGLAAAGGRQGGGTNLKVELNASRDGLGLSLDQLKLIG